MVAVGDGTDRGGSGHCDIREARPSDYTDYFIYTLSALTEVELTPAELHDLAQRRNAAGIKTFVAVQDNVVVGTASLLLEQKFIHSGGLVAHVEDVAVHPKRQHAGIGSRLLRHLLQVARDAGCYKVILNCRAELTAFYEHLGFTVSGQQLRCDLDVPRE